MMTQQTIDRRAAAAAERSILKTTGRFWEPSDLRLPASTAHHLLSRLVEAGELRRVRRGLYWRGRKTLLGMAPPPQDVLIAELAPGNGVGPAGLSAANALRLSTQVPRRAEYAVPHRAPRDIGTLKFVSRTARTGRAKSKLTPAEVAALEVLDAWESVIEVPPSDAMSRLEGLLRKGDLRPEKLAAAATTEPGPAKERLKTLLEHTGNGALAAKIAPKPGARRSTRTTRTAPLAAK
jgi:hypothetical protein